MFAVIKTGGKQYKVSEGDQLVVEKLAHEAGEQVTFGDVLMVGGGSAELTVGAPTVDGASVVASVLEQRKGDKIIIRKKRQRSTYRRTQGHRQLQTVLAIDEILTGGAKPSGKRAEIAAEAPAAAPAEAQTEEAPVPAPAAETLPAPADLGGELEALDERGRLEGPVGDKDDLKKIKGVGKVLEGKLNDAGIFHFWQIAALTEAQIEDLEGDMSFPGRIGRDNWADQAREFGAAG